MKLIKTRQILAVVFCEGVSRSSRPTIDVFDFCIRRLSPSSERCSFDSSLTPAFLTLDAVAKWRNYVAFSLSGISVRATSAKTF